MKMSETRPSKYLKAADLGGREAMLTIDFVEMREMQGQDDKPVLFFSDTPKGLVSNVTNSRVIEDKYGDESDDWSGRPITVYPTETEFSGKRVPCLRVKIPKPVVTVPADGSPNDSIPF